MPQQPFEGKFDGALTERMLYEMNILSTLTCLYYQTISDELTSYSNIYMAATYYVNTISSMTDMTCTFRQSKTKYLAHIFIQ